MSRYRVRGMATQVAAHRPSIHRLTVADTFAMDAAGIFGECDRVELIDGVLVDMSPIGPPHSNAVEWLTYHFVRGAPDDVRVRIQDMIVISDYSYVLPDLMVVEPIWRDTSPTAALFVVEVAQTSFAHDVEKAAMYAGAAVPEYWIVDLVRKELVVHREPRDGTYASIRRFVAGDVVTPLLDVPPVDVGTLLAP